MDMRTIAAAKFKEQCLAILDNVDLEGIVITKRGKPVAKLFPIDKPQSHARFIGILKGEVIVDPNDNLFSTGEWVSEEWGDLNNG